MLCCAVLVVLCCVDLCGVVWCCKVLKGVVRCCVALRVSVSVCVWELFALQVHIPRTAFLNWIVPRATRARGFNGAESELGSCMTRHEAVTRLVVVGDCALDFAEPPAGAHSKLRNCHWVCKRGAPFMRCKYDFDHYGKHGIQRLTETSNKKRTAAARE